MEVALAGARRHSQQIAVLFMDIDGFKGTNDTMGHAAGDALLTGFAERLRGVVRQDETLARISGDEFAILLPSIEGREEAEKVAMRVIDQLKNPFVLGGRNVPITVSIGGAIYEGGETSLEELLARADAAMYEVKDRGGNGYRSAE
jgi:diguanylate cyclase (GGDEF)-like protein